MARMLASVTDEHEARLVVSLGADIVDAKDPGAGALGALPFARVEAIRAALPAHVPVSATVGDPSDDVEAIASAAIRMADTGIEIVKVGLSMRYAPEANLARLGTLDLGGAQLVGVLLADHGIDPALIAHAAAAGCVGLMLDTAAKGQGALSDIVPAEQLAAFVAAVQAAGMFAGLAGSLRVNHVAPLIALGPDVLGFRGGLCRAGDRTGALDAEAIAAVRQAVSVCSAARDDACRVPMPDAMAPAQTEGLI
ncbi:(5-formylfuran-3-yl)methyl phosphate synthase [Hyphomicrobium sulfonivorans]|uniref:(5-formylfuran-3-yl)methyl phosphate synthase n=1 Tax=Hyphomicrobium sulfonivorans TaxID=121290 RepID=UPI00156E017F|nr:(5-formylfuran-3-yl)methyl phosphate synthase [Hyphomicrobium sulfonivorans]MBI1650975.1 (5-formylfuran-3-yl)methyl phosphate synthase [Hyphomicrobium sulfonivorans]NSL72641.1 hypothetical protein [Hyphomicrobium sulfonivorans]